MNRFRDDDIIARVLAGERDLYALLVRKYSKAVYNLMLRHVGDPGDAKDLSQEAFLQAFRKMHQYRYGERFYGWIMAMAVNLARDYHRRKKRHQNFADEMFATRQQATVKQTFDAAHESWVAWQTLMNGLGKLSLESREALLWRYRDGLTNRQIADILGLSVSAVKMRILRAIQQLKNILGMPDESR